MYKYHKIDTIFHRDTSGSKKLIPWDWRDVTVEYLKDCRWIGTEKIDGTNIGIYWDGHEVTFQGRTERAQIPKILLDKLQDMFDGEINAQLFEQVFGDKEVVLFGEGYGNKIQGDGAKYIPDDVSFILFDIYMPNSDIYLTRDSVVEVAKMFNINVVPVVFSGTLSEAIQYVQKHPMSQVGDLHMEGIVCRPAIEMKSKTGDRIIVKIKWKDFKDITCE